MHLDQEQVDRSRGGQKQGYNRVELDRDASSKEIDRNTCIVMHDSVLHIGMAPPKNGGSNQCINSYMAITRPGLCVQQL